MSEDVGDRGTVPPSPHSPEPQWEEPLGEPNDTSDLDTAETPEPDGDKRPRVK
jgi:hypothetical protein